MDSIKTILVDNSFCTRLFKTNDNFHQSTVEYFKYFIEQNKELYLSTIIVSEYAVADDPDNLLKTENFRLLEFDYKDACISGQMFSLLKENRDVIQEFGRNVVINDLKLLAQAHSRNIDAIVSKDKAMYRKMIQPLKEQFGLSVEFIDIAIPLHKKLGRLF